MGRVTAEARALPQELQDRRRKAELDAHRRDEPFAAGDEVLLDTEHTPPPPAVVALPAAGPLPFWMGPFKALARTAPPAIPPACFAEDLAPPGDLGAALVGRTILNWWPEDGWQRGTVARPCPRGAFSHVVAYGTAGRRERLRSTADTLPDAASYGVLWVLLSPGSSVPRLGGSGPPLWPGPPTLTPSQIRRSLVTA